MGVRRAGARRGQRQRGRRNDAAVSEVLGTGLMMTITVGMVGTFAILVQAFTGPVEHVHTDLVFTMGPGAAGWSTGDETLRLEHRGGPALRSEQVTFILLHDGAETRTPGSAMGGALADGRWELGEAWTGTQAIDLCDRLRARITVVTDNAGQLLFDQTEVAGAPLCPGA